MKGDSPGGTCVQRSSSPPCQERAFERQERAFAFQVQTFENLITLTERMIERLDDMGDQIRANTQAVLRALDRMDGPRPSEG